MSYFIGKTHVIRVRQIFFFSATLLKSLIATRMAGIAQDKASIAVQFHSYL